MNIVRLLLGGGAGMPRTRRRLPSSVIAVIAVAIGVGFSVLLISVAGGVSDYITGQLSASQVRRSGLVDVDVINTIVTLLTGVVTVHHAEGLPRTSGASIAAARARASTRKRTSALTIREAPASHRRRSHRPDQGAEPTVSFRSSWTDQQPNVAPKQAA